ncbi:MAG: aminotransferase class I/II-fold pyridoxal phosphate-dependent enzyme [Actinomycetota bacterium]
MPAPSEALIDEICSEIPATGPDTVTLVEGLIARNAEIHDHECLNLNPATNTMRPRAAAALSAGLGSRTSLGYPGAKYEMGLEAIERIEAIAAELACRLFGADHAEVRVPSGAMANLYAFMATAQPGDTIIAPPASIGGHVTHHTPGAAGLYGLVIHEAPIDADRYTVDVDGVDALAAEVKPALITVGASLNLAHHDVVGLRAVADRHGAHLLFDAAHLSGPIAGGAWPDPLAEGAHLMTMSTYKSLGGPTAGLVVTNDAELAERLDRIAFPGLTANFDAGKTAALAITLADWLDGGTAEAAAMVACARALAAELSDRGVAVQTAGGLPTLSHAFAVDATTLGGGAAVARHLRKANLLASAIGLPHGADAGVRVGTNELVRLGAGADQMAPLADLIARALTTSAPHEVAPAVTAFRQANLRLP